MNILRCVAWLLLAGVGCARSTRAEAPTVSWQEEKLRTLEGAETSVSDFRGKVVLLDFWASWCEPCRFSMPFYRKLQEDLGPKGFTVVGVNLDENAALAREVVSREKLVFPVLWDPRATLPDRLSIQVMPTALLLDVTGEVRHRHSGFVAGDDARLREQVEGMLAAVPAQ